jgi:hypothetical protein
MLIVTVVLFLSLLPEKIHQNYDCCDTGGNKSPSIHDMPFIVVFPVFIFILQNFNVAYFMGSSAVILSASNLQEMET